VRWECISANARKDDSPVSAPTARKVIARFQRQRRVKVIAQGNALGWCAFKTSKA
jgi:hypothetical protein